MPLTPRIDVLDTSTSTSFADMKTPGSSKSMKFKSLFRWRKTADAMPRPQTHAGESPTTANPPGIPSHNLLMPRPSVAVRSHSEHDVHRKPQTGRLKKRRDRARHITTTDPPPFIQAHSLALLHASLESPANFYDKSLSRRNSISSKTNNGTGLPETTVEVKRSHKRTASGESTCTLKEKVFYLTTDGHILQYDGEGGGDRLPEKILELGDESVAFASDAVPGHRWVLQITRNGTASKHESGPVLRAKWSKLTLRNVESKRTVDTMLLVFGDPEDLYTWLFAVRKEIEQFGGLEYRPDTEEDDQSWRDELAKTYGEATNIRHVGDHLDSFPDSMAFDSSKTSTDTARLAAPLPARTKSMQSIASSTASASSLDRLRDSVTSDGYPSTVATSSADGSLPATSPTVDSFPVSKQHAERNSEASSPRLSSMNDTLVFRMSNLSPPPVSIQERRKLSATSMQIQRDSATPSLTSIASANKTALNGQSSPTDRPMSTIAPLPTTLTGRRSLHATRHKPSTDVSSTSTDVPDGRPPSSFRAPSVRKPSISESLSDTRKPKYSLFPVRAHENKPEITVSPAPNALPSIQTTEVAPEDKDHDGHQTHSAGAHRKTRSRTLTLNLPSYQAAPGLLSPMNTDFSKPQRSPAVTDAMIMSNFGAFSLQPQPSSPLPNVNVPGLKDLSMDLDFLKTPPPQKRSRSPLSKKKMSPIKSMPNILGDSLGVARAPVGPPPTGPLPAVPFKIGSRPSSRGRISGEPEGRRRSSGRSSHKDVASAPAPQAPQPAPQHAPKEQKTVTKATSHKHSRTISNSNDGPPPPPRSSSVRLVHDQPRIGARTS